MKILAMRGTRARVLLAAKWGLIVFLALAACAPPLASAGEATPARRIVSLGPNITEAVYALGRGDRLVGVSSFTVYPPAARDLPNLGGYLNPNLERLLVLRPDLVLVQYEPEKVARFCKKEGIRLVRVRMDSLETIYEGLTILGRALDAEAEAARLRASIQAELRAVAASVSGLPRRRVFICLGRAPDSLSGLFTAGGASFLTEVLDIAGGDNVFADLGRSYPEISKESLVKRAPEVILELRPGESIDQDRARRMVADWQALRGLPAVDTGQVHLLTQDYLLIPGPRVGAVARLLARTLHPELAP